jgi:hypothetical protein
MTAQQLSLKDLDVRGLAVNESERSGGLMVFDELCSSLRPYSCINTTFDLRWLTDPLWRERVFQLQSLILIHDSSIAAGSRKQQEQEQPARQEHRPAPAPVRSPSGYRVRRASSSDGGRRASPVPLPCCRRRQQHPRET